MRTHGLQGQAHFGRDEVSRDFVGGSCWLQEEVCGVCEAVCEDVVVETTLGDELHVGLIHKHELQ